MGAWALAGAWFSSPALGQCNPDYVRIGPCEPGSCWRMRVIRGDGSISSVWSGTVCQALGETRYGWCCRSNADGYYLYDPPTANSTTAGLWRLQVYKSSPNGCTSGAGENAPVGYIAAEVAFINVLGTDCQQLNDVTEIPPADGTCHQPGEDFMSYDPETLYFDEGAMPVGWRFTGQDPVLGGSFEVKTYDGAISGVLAMPPDIPSGGWIVSVDLIYSIDDGMEEAYVPYGAFCVGNYPDIDTGGLPDGEGDPTQPVTGGDMQTWLDGLADRLQTSINQQTAAINSHMTGLHAALSDINSGIGQTNSLLGGIAETLGDWFTTPDEAQLSTDFALPGGAGFSPRPGWHEILTLPNDLPSGGVPLSFNLPLTDAFGVDDVYIDFGNLPVSSSTFSLIKWIIMFGLHIQFVRMVLSDLAAGGL